MTATSETRSGTPRLSELARHVVVPSGIVSTGWPAVRNQCRDLGVVFDPWQDGAGRLILSKRADGTYACSIGGVVISIPRQVGKTFLVGAIVFALCLLRPGLRVIWTAHHTDTSGQTFQSMQGFARRRKIAPHVKKVLIDDESIEFLNGSVIMFGARERGFGRGIPNIAVLVFDEAQILTERSLSDMVPTMNRAVNPLLLLMGTPPKPGDRSEVFSNRRAEALSGESDDMGFIEFSADPGCRPDDRKQWAKANPSYPSHTPDTAMLRMLKNLGPESFRREGLGIWDDDSGSRLFDMGRWATLAVPLEAQRPEPVALSVAVSNDRQWGHIGLAGMRADGRRHLQVVRSGRGTDWLPGAVAELEAKWSPVGVAVQPGSPAGSLLPELERLKVRTVLVSGRDRGQAVGMFLDGFGQGSIVHQDQQVLGMSLESAQLRDVGEVKVWDHRVEGVDVAPLQAVTDALFVLSTVKPRKRGGQRRAVVL